ncbi:delta subunit of the central stalk of mitochondrial F1F0 ATP synthase, atp16 [Borealophlyctis nickersoniae]|nr:delta subunit of the central stalk of mitochondrial F1F0 ATP synthase, atp16 [Borealophlyctis nickersoniae]
MLFLRAASRSVRQATSYVTPARSYATEAGSSAGKMIVNFTAPHQTLLKSTEATQVNLSSTDGDMGILADHVPTIAELKPGIIEIFTATEKPKKYFVSGGFAAMNPDSTLNINALEAVTLEDVDFDAAKRAADDATRRVSAATTETERVEAKIELDVYEALLAAHK